MITKTVRVMGQGPVHYLQAPGCDPQQFSMTGLEQIGIQVFSLSSSVSGHTV